MNKNICTLVVLLAAFSPFIPAQADLPIAPSTDEGLYIDWYGTTTVEWLQIAAKTYGVDVLIDDDVVRFVPYAPKFEGNNAKETFEWIARIGKLTITEEDGVFYARKAAGDSELIPSQQNPLADGLQMKLRLHSQPLRAGDSLESRWVPERRSVGTEAAMGQGASQNPTLSPDVVALSGNSRAPSSHRLFIDMVSQASFRETSEFMKHVRERSTYKQ